MSLPLASQTFYRMPDASPAAATIAGLLDAIYTSLSSTTDYRGTSLASTHLWTIGRQQTTGTTNAVYATPPSGTSMAKSPGIIFAGHSGAPTPTMASPDSFTASNLLLGIAHTRGAWNAWDAAAPFTSGTFSGYWRAAGTTWNATAAVVRVYVSQEQIFVQLIGATVTNQAWMCAGAIVEPHFSYSDSSGNDCETDDRLYGMWSTGATGTMSTSWLQGVGTTHPVNHGTSAGNAHMMVFQPGTSNLYACGRKTIFHTGSSTAEAQTSGGGYVGDLLPVCRSTGASVNNGARLGVLRSVYPSGQLLSGRTLRNGSTDLYHVVGCDTTLVGDALLLKAAA